jgi:hypothetical protein
MGLRRFDRQGALLDIDRGRPGIMQIWRASFPMRRSAAMPAPTRKSLWGVDAHENDAFSRIPFSTSC